MSKMFEKDINARALRACVCTEVREYLSPCLVRPVCELLRKHYSSIISYD